MQRSWNSLIQILNLRDANVNAGPAALGYVVSGSVGTSVARILDAENATLPELRQVVARLITDLKNSGRLA